MNYKKVKLKNICNIVKGETGITKAIPGDYPMVTLAEERKSHNEYQFDTKAVIIPLVSSTGHGHASMKRIHYQEGKFALGTILCALVAKQDDVYDPEYLYYILDSNKENIFVPLMKGMANVSLPMKRIKEVEINLPPLDNQRRMVQKFSALSEFNKELSNKTIFQKENIKQLRQSILQLAVQGRLTANWRRENPDVEPAKALLERIRAEKEKLIKEKKIKRQKPLPEIDENEKPFELPVGWEFIRLNIICSKIGSGSTPRGGKDSYCKNGIKFFRSQNVYNDGIKLSDIVYISEDIHKKMKGTQLEPLDILLNITGGSIGRSSVLPNNFDKGNVSQHVSIIRLIDKSLCDYVHNLILSEYFQETIINAQTGAGREGLPKNRLEKFVIPIPPLPEQKAIVEKTNQLMSWCDELEKKAQEREKLHEKTMLAVVQGTMIQ